MIEIKNKFEEHFSLKSLGSPKNFLGINITRDVENRVMKLSQPTFIKSMLKKFGYENVRSVSTPMCTNQVQNRERRERENAPTDENAIEVTKYRQAIGSLLYLANATRPDIMYAVNVLSRHQLNPTRNEWNMVERVFRYLAGTIDLELTYIGNGESLEGYSDATLADCKGSLMISGHLIQLFGDSVEWHTHKQTRVALSTCQAEYSAMCDVCRELVAMHMCKERI